MAGGTTWLLLTGHLAGILKRLPAVTLQSSWMAEISIQRSELFQPVFVSRELIRDLRGGGATREVWLCPEDAVLTSQKLLKLF